MAVGSNVPMVGASEVHDLEERDRDIKRRLGRKTMENEILRGPTGPWPRGPAQARSGLPRRNNVHATGIGAQTPPDPV